MKRIAFALSFLLYAFPLLSPHGWLTVAQVLGHLGQDVPWAVANFAVVILAQLSAFLWLSFWLSRKGPRPVVALAVIGVAPLEWYVLSLALMQLVPEWRLIEPDSAPEHTTLATECRLDDKWLELAGQSGRVLVSKEPRSEAVVRSSDGSRYWLLKFPGCKLEEIPLPKNTMEQAYALVASARGNRFLYTTARRGRVLQDTGALIDGKLVPLETFAQLDPTRVSPPRLSPDGSVVAWIDRQAGEVKTAKLGPHGLGVASGFPLRALGAGTFELLDLSDEGRELLVTRDSREFKKVSFKGKLISTFIIDSDVHPILSSVRVLSDDLGHLAWEPYREQGRYLVEWITNGKSIRKEFPKGRSLTSGDISPDAQFIAVSTAPGVSVGKIEDAVVIWSADGTEVFRKHLGAYSRAPVAFFSGNLVAYSQIDRQGHGVTQVLKLW